MILLCNSERDPVDVDVWILNSSLILCNSLGTKGKIISGKWALELKADLPRAIQNHEIIITIMIGTINGWIFVVNLIEEAFY